MRHVGSLHLGAAEFDGALVLHQPQVLHGAFSGVVACLFGYS
jgi:hypothetical protein